MLDPVLVTPPADPPVTVDECKSHIRVTHSSDDTLIGIYRDAAVARLDGRAGLLNRCMVTQSWRQDFGCWPDDRILRLPFPNVSAATLKYFDESNVEQTVGAGNYDLYDDARGSFLKLKDAYGYPAAYSDRLDRIRATLTAGYGTASSVPKALKQAILLLVGHYYENREFVAIGTGIDVREIPETVAALIANYRRVGV